MVLNRELMFNRRIVRSRRDMRQVAGEVQMLGLTALRNKLVRNIKKFKQDVIYYKPWNN